MLTTELTIGVYINGKLDDVLIVPDGHEYHLFLTGVGATPHNYVRSENPESMGSIVFINENWIYEGARLSVQSQQEIAEYIINH